MNRTSAAMALVIVAAILVAVVYRADTTSKTPERVRNSASNDPRSLPNPGTKRAGEAKPDSQKRIATPVVAKGKSRVSLQGQYERATNLQDFVEGLEPKLADDPGARTAYAEAMAECAPLSVDRNYLAHLAGNVVRSVPRYMIAAYRARCEALAQQKLITSDEVTQLLLQAANGGDIMAQAKLFAARPERYSPDVAEDQILAILRSGDPYAINELSGAFAHEASTSMSPYAGTTVDSFAWQLVACDLGMDCSASSYIVRQLCLFGDICGSGDLRNVLEQSVFSPRDFSRLEQTEAYVFNAISNRDLQALVTSSTAHP